MKQTAVLLINCPDRKGIVASVADFLYKHGANILHADEHQDSTLGLFFLRIEWDLKDFSLSENIFPRVFEPLAKQFAMEWQLHFSETKQNIALFVSKEDHCLVDLLYRNKAGELDGKVSLIVSNHPESREWAKFYNIPFHHFQRHDRESERDIIVLLKKNTIELVVLARYMQILSSRFVKAFPNKIINIHHSFLPAFIGARPYHQAHTRGVKIIGATSHYVTSNLDQGPIIEQDTIHVSHRDSVDDLVRKGKDLEKVVLSRAVSWHLQHKILCYGNKTVVFD